MASMNNKYVEQLTASVRDLDPTKQISKTKLFLDKIYPTYYSQDKGYFSDITKPFNFLCDSATGRIILISDNKQIVKELSKIEGTIPYFKYSTSRTITENFIGIDFDIDAELPWNCVCLLTKFYSPKIIKSEDKISHFHLYKYYLIQQKAIAINHVISITENLKTASSDSYKFQDFISTERLSQAKSFIAGDHSNVCYVNSWAEAYNLSLEEACKDIIIRTDCIHEYFSKLEQNRITYISKIISEQDLVSVFSHVEDLKTLIYSNTKI